MVKRTIIVLITIIILLLVWQISEDAVNRVRVESGRTGLEAFIPSPLTILKTFQNDGHIIFSETMFTLERAGIGFLLGTVFAFIIATLFLLLPFLRNVFFPIAFAINSFPIVGLAPVVILAFGQGSWFSIVFIATLISYFPTLISLDSSFRETDKELLELMHVFNASRWQIIRKVRLPLAMPYFLLAMKLAIPASIIGATMGEWLGSRNGIGQIITISLYQLKPGLLYASLFSVAGVIIFFLLLLYIVEQKFFPWRRVNHERNNK